MDIIRKDADKAIALRDKQIQFLFHITDSLRLKNRIRKLIPQKLLLLLGKELYQPVDIQDYPLPSTEDLSPSNPKSLYVYEHPKLNNETKETIQTFEKKPLISIIMPVYNVESKWLNLAIKSIENQWYTNWELCIADDKSTNISLIISLKKVRNKKIKITFLEENRNISGASNAALTLATGEYIVLMDNDDEITPDALYEIVKVINET